MAERQAVVGAAVAALPSTSSIRRLDAAESWRPLVGAEGSNADFGEAGDAIAYLDVLQRTSRLRLTAHQPLGPPVRVPVGGRSTQPRRMADIIAAPDSSADNWWYWFSWAERITAVHVPAVAADALSRPSGCPGRLAILAGDRQPGYLSLR